MATRTLDLAPFQGTIKGLDPLEFDAEKDANLLHQILNGPEGIYDPKLHALLTTRNSKQRQEIRKQYKHTFRHDPIKIIKQKSSQTQHYDTAVTATAGTDATTTTTNATTTVTSSTSSLSGGSNNSRSSEHQLTGGNNNNNNNNNKHDYDVVVITTEQKEQEMGKEKEKKVHTYTHRRNNSNSSVSSVSVDTSNSSNDYVKVLAHLLMDPAVLDAYHLNRALEEGPNTNETLLQEIICTRTGDQLCAMRDAYETKFGSDLFVRIRQKVGKPACTFMRPGVGDPRRYLVACLRNRPGEDGVNQAEANRDAAFLHKASKYGRNMSIFGTNESKFIEILAGISFKQMICVSNAYQTSSSGLRTLYELIDEEIDGELKKEFLVSLEHATCPNQYWGRRLYNILEGLEHPEDNEALTRIIVNRSEYDLQLIRDTFTKILESNDKNKNSSKNSDENHENHKNEHKKYKTLTQYIWEKTCGEYQKILLAILHADGEDISPVAGTPEIQENKLTAKEKGLEKDPEKFVREEPAGVPYQDHDILSESKEKVMNEPISIHSYQSGSAPLVTDENIGDATTTTKNDYPSAHKKSAAYDVYDSLHVERKHADGTRTDTNTPMSTSHSYNHNHVTTTCDVS